MNMCTICEVSHLVPMARSIYPPIQKGGGCRPLPPYEVLGPIGPARTAQIEDCRSLLGESIGPTNLTLNYMLLMLLNEKYVTC